MPDFHTGLTLLVLVAAGTWTVCGIAQWYGAWSDAKRRGAALVEAQKREAKALLKQIEDIERLDTEIRDSRVDIATTVTATAARREALAHFEPPAPVDIYVPSEFPASKRDRAWVVRMGRDGADGARSSEATDRLLLVWAGDHQLAMSRGRQLMGRRGYDAEAASRLG